MPEVFVPLYIGSRTFQRREIIHYHSPEWVKVLLPKAVAMIDSLYAYIQKSRKFNHQKKSYCQHKVDNLVKMMAIMLLDSKWFEIYSPYFSDIYNNDELMWNTLNDKKEMITKTRIYLLIVNSFMQPSTGMTCSFGERGFARCHRKWGLYIPDSV